MWAGPPGLVFTIAALLMGVVEHGRGLNFSVYFRREIREAVERQRGEKSVSAYLADLVKRDAPGGMNPAPGRSPAGAQVPPLLESAMVQHALVTHPGTGAQSVDGSMITPNRKIASDLEDPGHGSPFSVEHNLAGGGGGDLPPGAEVHPGHHRLNAARCAACVLVLRDAPSWA